MAGADPTRRSPLVSRLLERAEQATALDPVATRLRTAVSGVLKPGALKDLLHGVPLGHPLHPAMVMVPMGAWMSAGVLDALPGTGPATGALITTGLLSAGPAAVAGLADWADSHEQQQRVGLVHSSFTSAAVLLYSASLAARAGGRSGLGKSLAYAGLLAVSAGGFVGGHLAYRQAVGANHVEDVPHLVEPGWHDLGPLADLPEGAPVRRWVGDVPVLAVRSGADAAVLADACSHLSAPLSGGEVADGCITCPWHASVFDLATGNVVHGPATSPQPVFETKLVGPNLHVSLPGAG